MGGATAACARGSVVSVRDAPNDCVRPLDEGTVQLLLENIHRMGIKKLSKRKLLERSCNSAAQYRLLTRIGDGSLRLIWPIGFSPATLRVAA
jgi:hypothetical protein